MNDIQIFERTKPAELMQITDTITGGSMLTNPRLAAHLANVASVFARSNLVPDHYKGKPAEILIALDSARNLGVDGMVFLQSTTVISGRQGMSASLITSLVQRSGLVKGAIRFEEDETSEMVEGMKNMRCRAWAIEKETGEKLIGPWVDLKMAKAEGWFRNPKYKSMPGIMLEKRALTFFARRFFPETLNGMHEATELEDMRESFHDLPTMNSAPQIVEPASPIFKVEKVDATQEEIKPGTKAWYVKELEKIGVSASEDEQIKDLKAKLKKTKLVAEEKAKAEEAEVEEEKFEAQEESIPEANFSESEDITLEEDIDNSIESSYEEEADDDEEFGDLFNEE